MHFNLPHNTPIEISIPYTILHFEHELNILSYLSLRNQKPRNFLTFDIFIFQSKEKKVSPFIDFLTTWLERWKSQIYLYIFTVSCFAVFDCSVGKPIDHIIQGYLSKCYTARNYCVIDGIPFWYLTVGTNLYSYGAYFQRSSSTVLLIFMIFTT